MHPVTVHTHTHTCIRSSQTDSSLLRGHLVAHAHSDTDFGFTMPLHSLRIGQGENNGVPESVIWLPPPPNDGCWVGRHHSFLSYISLPHIIQASLFVHDEQWWRCRAEIGGLTVPPFSARSPCIKLSFSLAFLFFLVCWSHSTFSQLQLS